MEIYCTSVSYPLGGMNTSDQQTSNTINENMCRLTFIMESTFFTNFGLRQYFVLSRNVVSLTSLERLRKSPIIQEIRRWPGQSHELHGLRQTVIKGGNAVISRRSSQPRNNFLASTKQQKTQKTKEKKEKKINTHIKTSLCQNFIKHSK